MIVETMTFKEIRKEIKKDAEKIRYRADKERNKRNLDYCTKREVWKSDRTKNEYVIYYIVEQRGEYILRTAQIYIKIEMKNKLCYMTFPHHFWDGETANDERDPAIFVYTPHFVKRYNERYLKSNLGNQEIFEEYLKRDNGISWIPGRKDSWKHKTEETQGIELRGNGGIILGMRKTGEEEIIICNTFISENLLRKDQEELKISDWLRENYYNEYLMSKT